jgi:hypothetical protein
MHKKCNIGQRVSTKEQSKAAKAKEQNTQTIHTNQKQNSRPNNKTNKHLKTSDSKNQPRAIETKTAEPKMEHKQKTPIPNHQQRSRANTSSKHTISRVHNPFIK